MSTFIHDTNKNSARYSIFGDLDTLISHLQNAKLLLDVSYQIQIGNIFHVNKPHKFKHWFSNIEMRGSIF